MELTKDQITEIENYIASCGVEFYDVRSEIVDHFASKLENELEQNSTLSFKQEISKIHRSFSAVGFKKLLKLKRTSVNKRIYLETVKHLITFFKLPKIIITAFLFFVLIELMTFFEDKDLFFSYLHDFGMFLVALIFVRAFIQKKKASHRFLVLNKTENYIQMVNFLNISFNLITILRSDESFLNPLNNKIQVGIFVLLLLFYWSGEYVYSQNRKQIKEQYPNVII